MDRIPKKLILLVIGILVILLALIIVVNVIKGNNKEPETVSEFQTIETVEMDYITPTYDDYNSLASQMQKGLLDGKTLQLSGTHKIVDDTHYITMTENGETVGVEFVTESGEYPNDGTTITVIGTISSEGYIAVSSGNPISNS